MRLNPVTAGAAVILSAFVGCGRTGPSRPFDPVQVTINPDKRTWSIGAEAGRPDSPDHDLIGYGGIPPSGDPKEWNTGIGIWSKDRDKDPQIQIRLKDGDRRAVSVEVTFKGPSVPRLTSIAFPHVTKSERFRLKTSRGEYAYADFEQKGENLILRWPKEGDGTVTFLAWPHVH